MPWMARWPGGFPLYVKDAAGAHLVDVDDHAYVDLCLGDTGAMGGHSPPAVVDAVQSQLGRGITTMLPTEDSIRAAEELARRFRVDHWQFTLSATTPTAAHCAWRGRLRDARRSWYLATAIMGLSMKRSPCATLTGKHALARAMSGLRLIPPPRLAPLNSTMSCSLSTRLPTSRLLAS